MRAKMVDEAGNEAGNEEDLQIMDVEHSAGAESDMIVDVSLAHRASATSETNTLDDAMTIDLCTLLPHEGTVDEETIENVSEAQTCMIEDVETDPGRLVVEAGDSEAQVRLSRPMMAVTCLSHVARQVMFLMCR